MESGLGHGKLTLSKGIKLFQTALNVKNGSQEGLSSEGAGGSVPFCDPNLLKIIVAGAALAYLKNHRCQNKAAWLSGF